MSETLLTFQLLRGLLKARQSENILRMFLTLLTSQLFRGWLKARQPRNISDMLVTRLTDQLLSGWSKAEQLQKAWVILVTWLTSQPASGELKERQYANMPLISSTLLRFGVSIFAEKFKNLAPKNALRIVVQATSPNCITSNKEMRFA